MKTTSIIVQNTLNPRSVQKKKKDGRDGKKPSSMMRFRTILTGYGQPMIFSKLLTFKLSNIFWNIHTPNVDLVDHA